MTPSPHRPFFRFATGLLVLAGLGLGAAGCPAGGPQVPGAASAAVSRPFSAWKEAVVVDWRQFGPFQSFEEEDYLNPFDIPEEEIDLLHGRPGAKPEAWKAAVPDPAGKITLTAAGDTGVYLFTELQREKDGPALLKFRARASVQLWLNGKIVYHDPHVYNLPRWGDHCLAVPMKAGPNALLVKTVARESLTFRMSVLEPEPPYLYVDTSNLLLPDLRVGEKLDGWGSVMVVNCSDRPVPSLMAELRAIPTAKHADIKAIPFFMHGREPQSSLAAYERRRFVFRCQSVREFDAQEFEAALIVGEGSECLGGPGWIRVPVQFVPKQPSEPFVVTYRSKLDGSVQPISVRAPTWLLAGEEDARAKTIPLILSLHGANVDDRFQINGYTSKEDMLIAAPYGRGSNRYREAARIDVEESLDEVLRRYKVDPDRVVLAGHSQGGYGTWLNGVQHPDRFAALAPSSAVSDYVVRRRPRRGNRSEAARKLDERFLRETRPFFFLENLKDTPVFCLHGGGDGGVTPDNSRRMAERLKELKYGARYHEAPGQGHWWGDRPTGGADCVDLPDLIAFLKDKKRACDPREVIFRTCSLRWNRSHWVQVDRIRDLSKDAVIRAEALEGNRLRLTLDNVERVTLDLPAPLFDRDQALEIEVSVAGDPKKRQYVHDAPLPKRLTWDRLSDLDPAEPEAELEKTPERFGPMSDLFTAPFLIVYGTRGSAAETEAGRRQAFIEAYRWQVVYNGQARVVADVDVGSDLLHTHNLLLFGNPGTNALIARAEPHLPLRFAADGLTLGDRKIGGKDVAVRIIYPSPWDPKRYLGICGAVSVEGMEQLHRPEPELPDYVVFDRAFSLKGWAALRAAGFFDREWKPSAEGEFFPEKPNASGQ